MWWDADTIMFKDAGDFVLKMTDLKDEHPLNTVPLIHSEEGVRTVGWRPRQDLD